MNFVGIYMYDSLLPFLYLVLSKKAFYVVGNKIMTNEKSLVEYIIDYKERII